MAGRRAVESGEARFAALVGAFPSMARMPGAAPWDAELVLQWLCRGSQSHGEALTARFLLGVWNSHADWVHEAASLGYVMPAAAKRFDVIEAAGVWDAAHLAAFASWAREPFFP